MKLKIFTVLFSSLMVLFAPLLLAKADTVSVSMKELDKAYLTLVFDDNTETLKDFFEIITLEYGYPICAAVPSNTLKDSNKVLHDIENHGGEILSHTKTHKVFNRSVPWETVDAEMKDSLSELTAAGFNVNGIILAGGGGTEDTDLEYRTEIEKITSKYYLYSDLYGVSTQYYKPRSYLKFTLNNNPKIASTNIKELAKTTNWEVWFAHNTTEFNKTTLRAMLDEIKAQEEAGKLEVVTYRTMYTNNAVWQGNVDLGKTKYTVDFYSTDNKTLIYSAAVEEGGSATAPQIETAKGVKFKNWSGSFSNVTKNMSVYAICENVKTHDPSAVGLKHNHSFIPSVKTQTCKLCGLVTALTESPTRSEPTSTVQSTSSAVSSEITSSAVQSVTSEDALSSDSITSKTDETSSVLVSSDSLENSSKSSKKGLTVAAIVVGVASALTAAFLIIRKNKKK